MQYQPLLNAKAQYFKAKMFCDLAFYMKLAKVVIAVSMNRAKEGSGFKKCEEKKKVKISEFLLIVVRNPVWRGKKKS